MTKARDDGGSAFPRSGNEFEDGQWGPGGCKDGMSLRDWFAGQVLANLHTNEGVNADASEVARICYRYADAMLRARREE